MAMQSGDTGGEEPLAEINVTPMVDVLLSLLIIFMVAQPKPPNEQIPINVPQNPVQQLPDDNNASLLITIDAENNAKIGKEPLSSDYDKMVEQFKNNKKAQEDDKVVVAGDDKSKYGMVIRIMAAAHEAGIEEVGIASKRL